MGLIAKLKLLIKTAKPVGKFVNELKGAKTKWKTIPFLVTVVGNLIAIVGGLNGFIPVTIAVCASSGLTFIYGLLRGFDKAGQEGIKEPWKTTEFWMTIAALASNAILDMQAAGVNNQVFVLLQSVLGSGGILSQYLGAQQPEDVTKMVEDSKN